MRATHMAAWIVLVWVGAMLWVGDPAADQHQPIAVAAVEQAHYAHPDPAASVGAAGSTVQAAPTTVAASLSGWAVTIAVIIMVMSAMIGIRSMKNER